VSQVLNPLSGEHEDALGPLFTILAVTLFLVAGLHLALIGALASSMAAFPLGGGLPPTLGEIGVSAITLAIELGVRVALPLAVVLLLTELAVGLLARAITTINVFLLGLPLKIMVGLIGLLLAIPYIGRGAMEAFTAIFQLATGASVR
jgi:flagellar biosynthesis protein FliR